MRACVCASALARSSSSTFPPPVVNASTHSQRWKYSQHIARTYTRTQTSASMYLTTHPSTMILTYARAYTQPAGVRSPSLLACAPCPHVKGSVRAAPALALVFLVFPPLRPCAHQRLSACSLDPFFLSPSSPSSLSSFSLFSHSLFSLLSLSRSISLLFSLFSLSLPLSCSLSLSRPSLTLPLSRCLSISTENSITKVARVPQDPCSERSADIIV